MKAVNAVPAEIAMKRKIMLVQERGAPLSTLVQERSALIAMLENVMTTGKVCVLRHARNALNSECAGAAAWLLALGQGLPPS